MVYVKWKLLPHRETNIGFANVYHSGNISVLSSFFKLFWINILHEPVRMLINL